MKIESRILYYLALVCMGIGVIKCSVDWAQLSVLFFVSHLLVKEK